MEKSIETRGATVKEAIQKALDKLGVTKDKVDVRVLSEEKKGLFGMKGQRQARVKVTLK